MRHGLPYRASFRYLPPLARNRLERFSDPLIKPPHQNLGTGMTAGRRLQWIDRSCSRSSATTTCNIHDMLARHGKHSKYGRRGHDPPCRKRRRILAKYVPSFPEPRAFGIGQTGR